MRFYSKVKSSNLASVNAGSKIQSKSNDPGLKLASGQFLHWLFLVPAVLTNLWVAVKADHIMKNIKIIFIFVIIKCIKISKIPPQKIFLEC